MYNFKNSQIQVKIDWQVFSELLPGARNHSAAETWVLFGHLSVCQLLFQVCGPAAECLFFFFHPPPQWKWETSHLLCSDLANCAMPMFKFCQMSWNVVSQWGRDSLSSPFERGREGMQWKAFGHQQWIQLLPVSLLSFYLLKYFYNTEVTYKAVAFLIFLTHFSSPSLHVPSHHTFICYLFKLFLIM